MMELTLVRCCMECVNPESNMILNSDCHLKQETELKLPCTQCLRAKLFSVKVKARILKNAEMKKIDISERRTCFLYRFWYLVTVSNNYFFTLFYQSIVLL